MTWADTSQPRGLIAHGARKALTVRSENSRSGTYRANLAYRACTARLSDSEHKEGNAA